MGDRRAVWSERFLAQAASGLSVAAYRRQHDLGYAQWMYWKRLLAGATASPQLLPIQVARPSSGIQVEVLAGPARVRVQLPDYAALAQLVHALQC